MMYTYGTNLQIINKVIEVIKKEKRGRVLDVGSGTGELCKKLQELQYRVNACDIDLTKFKYPTIPHKHGDLMQKLLYKKHSFDIVTCTEVLEHLENPWQAFREFKRLLKPKGILVISLPNFSSLLSRLVFFSRGNYREFNDVVWKNWGHINPLTFTEVYNIALKIGFTLIDVTTQNSQITVSKLPLRLVQFSLSKLLNWGKLMFIGTDIKDQAFKYLEIPSLLYGDNLIIKFRSNHRSQSI